MHIFKYSPREGTIASKMTNQVDGKVKDKRSKILIELSNQNQKQYNIIYLKKPQEVLFEEQKDGFWAGYTSNYIKILVKSNKDLENKLVTVKPEEII